MKYLFLRTHHQYSHRFIHGPFSYIIVYACGISVYACISRLEPNAIRKSKTVVSTVLESVGQAAFLAQHAKLLAGLLKGNHDALFLGGRVITVANVDRAGLLLRSTDNYTLVSIPETNHFKEGNVPKMKLYCASCPLRIFFCMVFPLMSISTFSLSPRRMV